jgi:hypothetical protein
MRYRRQRQAGLLGSRRFGLGSAAFFEPLADVAFLRALDRRQLARIELRIAGRLSRVSESRAIKSE